MTERQWEKLKAVDFVVNRRAPGIQLRIVSTVVRPGHIRVALPNGSGADIKNNRYKEFVQWFPQERLL